jgi:hypothetical protein
VPDSEESIIRFALNWETFSEDGAIVAATGQYTKLQLPGPPPREVIIWIDDALLRQHFRRLLATAQELFPDKSDAVSLRNLLSIYLFESLKSLEDEDTRIEFDGDGFTPMR